MRTGSLVGRAGGITAIPQGVKTVAGLDIGSTKISCIIAELGSSKRAAENDPRSALKVVGFGQIASKGIRAGSVVNIEEAEKAIRHAVGLAERMAERHVTDIVVNVSGGRPVSILSRAAMETQTGVVSPRDVDTVIASAVAGVDLRHRHVLHLMPTGFSLDGVACGVEPLGLHGREIGAEVGIVTVDPQAIRNLSLVIERCHLNSVGYAISPYASARGALAADELTLGTVLLDLGGATTGIAVFQDGRLAHAATLGLGGSHVTNDIAHGLSTTLAHAERMKTLFGTVLNNGHDDREMLVVPLLGERGVDSIQKIPKHMLTSIIRPRAEELLETVRDHLHHNGFGRALAGRIVLTGGTSQLQGIRELASDITGGHVRLAAPQAINGLPQSASSPAFSAVAGLVWLAARPDKQYAMPQLAQEAISRAELSYARRVGKWLAESI